MANDTNPALERLNVFVGEWNVELAFPTATARGQVSFRWLEDGAFLLMQTGDRTSNDPWSACVIGRDESLETYSILYYDWRGVSRNYQMSFDGVEWKQWRNSPGFSQRFSGTFSQDKNTITARWEKSSDGTTWEHDFDLSYRRVTKQEAG